MTRQSSHASKLEPITTQAIIVINLTDDTEFRDTRNDKLRESQFSFNTHGPSSSPMTHSSIHLPNRGRQHASPPKVFEQQRTMYYVNYS
jgi:hypothetical protein